MSAFSRPTSATRLMRPTRACRRCRMAEATGGLSLEVKDLVTSYGAIKALSGVSFTVPAGSITAVLGANGAGKSSLLRSLSGLVKPRSGSVLLGGKEIAGRAPEDVVQLGMSHVPEGRGVIAELTVDDNLRLGGLWRKDKADRSR